jgi:hypothetical protein
MVRRSFQTKIGSEQALSVLCFRSHLFPNIDMAQINSYLSAMGSPFGWLMAGTGLF